MKGLNLVGTDEMRNARCFRVDFVRVTFRIDELDFSGIEIVNVIV